MSDATAGAPVDATPDATTIAPLDQEAMSAARARWDGRAKPPGSLGRLEALAVHLAGMAGACPPPVPEDPAVVVFAGDHGVVADGASAWPSEVTALMVANLAGGGAAVCSFARTVGAALTVVDVGVAGDVTAVPSVVHRKVRPGTGSLAHGPAMTVDQARSAMAVGAEMADGCIGGGADLLVAGEMGIGNTTPAACLIAVICGAAPDKVVGPGAGLPDDRLAHKARLIARGVERASGMTGPVDLLAEVGGLELAAMAGFYGRAAARRVPVVVDGVIALASLLVADQLYPGTAARCIAGHRSTEPAADLALAFLGTAPLLDLDLRLGEGTGAVLAVPLIQAAARALRDMADLPAPSA